MKKREVKNILHTRLFIFWFGFVMILIFILGQYAFSANDRTINYRVMHENILTDLLVEDLRQGGTPQGSGAKDELERRGKEWMNGKEPSPNGEEDKPLEGFEKEKDIKLNFKCNPEGKEPKQEKNTVDIMKDLKSNQTFSMLESKNQKKTIPVNKKGVQKNKVDFDKDESIYSKKVAQDPKTKEPICDKSSSINPQLKANGSLEAA